MNEKFFQLPIEKQQRIINAGYRVFSQNSYKKSPVSEIAAEAGISKSLLFHYFKNKKELYLFLWDNCAKMTVQTLQEYGCYEKEDFFEIMYSGLRAKVQMMHKYPEMGRFALKAYYEKDPEVYSEIQASIEEYSAFTENVKKFKLEPKQFLPGIDMEMMYNNMLLASEGYLWKIIQQGNITAERIEKIEQDFYKMIEFWKKIYTRKKG